ncbi:hypothetical protein UT300007_01240 [Clostridium sp. CTA-7]
MSLKKIKRMVAQLLIIAFIVPNISAKAITNNVNSVIEETTINEDVSSSNQNVQAVDNSEKKEELKQDSSNDKEQNKVTDEALNNDLKENSSKQDSSNEIKKEEVKKEEEIKESKVTLDANSNSELKGTKYTKKKAINTNVKSFSMASQEGQEREEFKLKREALENLEVLEPMTDKPYELTIANSDGSFEYVDAYENLSEAVDAAKKMPEQSLASSQMPAVINFAGQVVYSTNQMARVIKYSNNSPVYGTVNLYKDPQLTDAFTYVNPGYMDDAPILEMSGTSAKVMINGYDGWINNNTSSGTYDMIVVPLNQVKNPSYYSVKNGELTHFISYDLTGVTGFTKTLGKAPSYLREGVRYLSYDGIYFYDGSNIEAGLNTLINDYRAGVRNNSLNGGNPHYLYYGNLPFRSKTVYSADDLNRYINAYTKSGSKLRDLGGALKEVENNYGVNALLTLAVSINESSYGMSDIAQTKNNLFGLKAYDSSVGSADSFASPRDSVVDFTKNYISRGYADPADWRYFGGFLGNKNRGANVKYASDPFWGEKAASFAYEIDKYLSGGNTNLKDTNANQVGMARTNNAVIKRDGSLLYNVTNDTNQYGGYINTPFIISDLQQVTINGQKYYEIYPERNTPVGKGGADNKYHGSYNWSDRGYISASNISLVNIFTPPVEVKSGIDRYATAVELSKSSFNSAETIVISNGYAIPDGLTATPIASYHKGPLLLVEKTSIPSSTQDEIKRLGAKNAIIVGGPAVVSQDVENKLRGVGVTNIIRLGGSTRYETALQVAKYIDQNLYDVENVAIANGYGEADALSIAPISGRDKMPIILVENNSISNDVYDWLKSESLNNAFIIGGTTAVNDNILSKINSITKQDVSGNRLGGANRYETNAKIIERFYGNVTEKVYVTEGLELADALTSGPIASLNGSPVIISESQLTYTQKLVLKNKTTNSIVQAGGVVSRAVIENLRELLSRTQ